VQGVVLPHYAAPAPEWMRAGHYHEVGPFTDGAILDHGASGNVLIRRSVIGDVRFHPAFNQSGGEDVDFFHRLLTAGATMVAATRAIAYEDVPPDRSTLRWILRRRYRTGHTLGTMARSGGRRGPRAVKALARLGFGIVEGLAGAVSSRTRAVRGLTNVVWGLGTLAALMGRGGQRPLNHI
jgi:succinoglycan biosynthesis protein ExoM